MWGGGGGDKEEEEEDSDDDSDNATLRFDSFLEEDSLDICATIICTLLKLARIGMGTHPSFNDRNVCKYVSTFKLAVEK